MIKVEKIFVGFYSRIHQEFDAAADFVWKTPRFLEDQMKTETKKLWEYFPPSKDEKRNELMRELRKTRAEMELGNIDKNFRFLLVTGSVFAVFSLFETYCLLMCKHLEPLCGI